MSILSIFEDTGDLAVLDPHETITRRLTPPHLRRPLAHQQGRHLTARASFAGLDDSGELPLIGIERQRPDETARIVVGRLVDDEPAEVEEPPVAEPRRPWFFRGTRRWTRSRALLFAATWPGGAR